MPYVLSLQAALQKSLAQAEAVTKAALSARDTGKSAEAAAAMANVKHLSNLLATANGALAREKQDHDAKMKKVRHAGSTLA